MFQRLLRMLVCGLEILFLVARGGNPVGVRGEIVHLCGSIVRVFWHHVSQSRIALDRRTIPSSTLFLIEQSMLTRVELNPLLDSTIEVLIQWRETHTQGRPNLLVVS